MRRCLLVFAVLAVAADAGTTWYALHHGYEEQTAATAQTIGTLGLTAGLLVTAAVRLAALAGALAAGGRFLPPRAQPLVHAVVATGVALTWLIVAQNVIWLT